LAFPLSVVTAKSWKLLLCISANFGVFSSLIRCSAAMLAMNPMPGRPSIRIGLFSLGFCVRCIVQTMVGFFLLGGFVGCGFYLNHLCLGLGLRLRGKC